MASNHRASTGNGHPACLHRSCVIGQLAPYTLDVAFCLKLGGVAPAFGSIQCMLPDVSASA